MKAIGIALFIAIFACSACLAGPAADVNVKSALHMSTHGTNTCKALPTINSVGDLVTTWNWPSQGTDIDVFYVVFDYDSMLTFEYAMNWPADWGTASFKSCAPALALGAITTPGTGTALTYVDCLIPVSQGGTARNFFTGSYVWLTPTSDGQIEIWANPATNELDVVDCRDQNYRAKHYIQVQYNAGVNVTPYIGEPYTRTEPTTWGAIKAMFE